MDTYHAAFVILLAAFVAVRVYYHRLARREAGRFELREGRGLLAARVLLAPPYFLAVLAYLPFPGLLAWASFPLPEPARWLGLVLTAVAVGLLWWVQWALGANFSTTLHVRDEHTLVTH